MAEHEPDSSGEGLAKLGLLFRDRQGRRRVLPLVLAGLIGAGGGMLVTHGDKEKVSAECLAKINREEINILDAVVQHRRFAAHVVRRPGDEGPKRGVELSVERKNKDGTITPLQENPIVLMCGSQVVRYLAINNANFSGHGHGRLLSEISAGNPNFQLEFDDSGNGDFTRAVEYDTPLTELHPASPRIARRGYTIFDNHGNDYAFAYDSTH